MSLAQFKDNVFEQQPNREQQSSGLNANPKDVQAEANTFDSNDNNQSSSLVPSNGDQPEGPGNPGEPVPINNILSILLLSGLVLIIYYQRKNKNINI